MQGAGYALHTQTCYVACRLCLLLLEPLFFFSANAGEFPGACVAKTPGSAASAVADGGQLVLPTSYEMLTGCMSRTPGKKRCCVYGRCPHLPETEEHATGTRLLCLSPAVDRAPRLLPLIPLRWVVHVRIIHRRHKSLETLLIAPWCIEAEFKRSRKLPTASWDWEPRPFPGMGKAVLPSPSLC